MRGQRCLVRTKVCLSIKRSRLTGCKETGNCRHLFFCKVSEKQRGMNHEISRNQSEQNLVPYFPLSRGSFACLPFRQPAKSASRTATFSNHREYCRDVTFSTDRLWKSCGKAVTH